MSVSGAVANAPFNLNALLGSTPNVTNVNTAGANTVDLNSILKEVSSEPSGPAEAGPSNLTQLASLIRSVSGPTPGGPSAATVANLKSIAGTMLPSLTEMATSLAAASGPVSLDIGSTSESGPMLVSLDASSSGPMLVGLDASISGPLSALPQTSGPSESNIQSMVQDLKELKEVQAGIDKVMAMSQLLDSEGNINVVFDVMIRTARNKLRRQQALLQKLKDLNA